jgi:SpoVK/Ycf46/Vps4 family AAA+-type ATPase
VSEPNATTWNESNQRFLMAAIGMVRVQLEDHLASSQTTGESPDNGRLAQEELSAAAAEMPSPSALELLCKMFGLSSFERDLLLLCAGVELESSFAALCAKAQGDPTRSLPTLSLALAILPNPHWSALTPSAPLRRWRLIDVGSGSVLTLSPLRIDERILHYLAGVQHLDERLAGLIERLQPAREIAPSHAGLAERIAVLWSQASRQDELPIVQLCGREPGDIRSLAIAACAGVGFNTGLIAAHSVPTGTSELDGFIRLWEREAILSHTALLLECRDLDSNDSARASAINRMIDGLRGPLVISSAEPRRTPRREMLTFDVKNITPGEQKDLWKKVLAEIPADLNGEVEAFVSQFDLNTQKIYSARTVVLGQKLLSESQGDTTFDIAAALWNACRVQARPRLSDLAQRLEPAATWNDLVLPDLQLRSLREIAVHVRRRVTVYETWGFAARGERGLGISALFSGVSGTGKTMAAEVLANELQLDLYRIDLSAVVSKYIGETEKNLRRVFDAAEEGGAILLFDEADALFGKRSEVKDSHDRYANIEVSYLLQRMEAYRGLAILTTNLKSALDTAFLRRIRFIVPFPFPDASQRTEIWRRIFPPQTPTKDLDLGKLSQLNVAGGNIRNIAMNAAFLAADATESVSMKHLLRAAQSEYAKLEKSLTETEIRGWV